MKRLLLRSIIPVVLLACASAATAEEVAIIDFLGFGWETGGVAPSQIGDELQLTAVASFLDPIMEVDLSTSEVTIHASGLMSQGEMNLGSTTVIRYTGGTLRVYRDGSQNAAWGTLPPNSMSPGTFRDGSLLFEGDFDEFQIAMSSSGAGVFEGRLMDVSGPLLSRCDNCVFTWGGNFNADAGAQVQEGYDLQIDGVLEIDESVSTTTSAWGALKALFEEGGSR